MRGLGLQSPDDFALYTVRQNEGWRTVAEAVIDELLPLACGLDIDAIVDGWVVLPPSAENALTALEAIAQELRSWPKGKQRVVNLGGLELDPNDLEHRGLFREAALWVIAATMWTRSSDGRSCTEELVGVSDTGSDFSFRVSGSQLESIFRRLAESGIDPQTWIGPAREIWDVERVKRKTAELAFSYAGVGESRTPKAVEGYRMTEVARVVGSGIDAFRRAVECVVSFDMHRAAGLDVMADTVPAADGTNLLLGLPIGPFKLRAPCRVVYVIDSPRMGGFAYGTLSGHPERGEARFEVSLDDRDLVTMRIFSFSRPARLISRIGGPVTRRIQDRVNRRYLDAVETAAKAAS